MFPSDWAPNWSHATAEGEEFVSFREANQETCDLLTMCYDVMGSQYLRVLMDFVNENPNDWRAFEVMAFSVRAVLGSLNRQFDSRKLEQEVSPWLASSIAYHLSPLIWHCRDWNSYIR